MNIHLKLAVLCAIAPNLWALPLDRRNVKIIGGEVAQPGQFPFIASLNKKTDGSHYCGASILNDHWIVTAAHCLDGATTDDFVVLTGTNLIDTGGTVYNASTILVYPDYNDTVYTGDLSLLKIDGSFAYSDLVQTIEIADVAGNDSVTVLGWGTTENTSFPNELRFANLTALTEEDCQKKSEGGDFILPRDGGEVCALAGPGISPCYGDSGGPLIHDGKLVGIVSHAVSPCARGYPDVYTKPIYFIDWINENIAK